MVDPGTGLTILGTAIGGAKIIEKILGPSADYIGNQIKEWAEKKISNTAKIFKNTEEKLGDKINDSGRVPPKVLKGILEDGAWCEEDLQIEYFGGVLASSRSENPRDDRGAYFVSLISRLSTYQLRTHYLVYHSLKAQFNGQKMNVAFSGDRKKMEFFIPYSTYYNALDFSENEMPNGMLLMEHAVVGLFKEKLIEDYTYGPLEHLKKRLPEADDAGIIFVPSMLGVELFMWAYGFGQFQNNDFFLHEIEFKDRLNIRLDRTIRKK
jgi:hypothetical protein